MRVGERLVWNLRQPYEIDGQIANVGVRVGLAVRPSGHVRPAGLLREAHHALQQGKAAGKGRIVFDDPGREQGDRV